MASLTHVCVWSDKGWKRITASEAARLHPSGGVSARSGLFMCELCGQYVLLTDSTVQVRHFRHSSAEKSKDCPERTFGAGVSVSYNSSEHELPIRIQNITRDNFEFSIGFIQIPQNLISKQLRIEIKSSTNGVKPFIYAGERLNINRITYFAVGGVPSEKYNLCFPGTADTIYHFWPRVVHGIDPMGTMFDASNGKKLVYDADVVVGKKYYLLRRGSLYGFYGDHVSFREIACKSISWSRWYLYEVMAKDFDEAAARFFLDYHCRLTETPITMQPVWPIYVEDPYVIKHNKKSVVMHVAGNAPTTQVFPYTQIRKYPCRNGSIIEIDCNSRQQLISAGRTKALQYTYFWREPLNKTTETVKATVTDLKDVPYTGGEYTSIPDRKALCVITPYDGIINVIHEGVLIDRRDLHANIPMEINDITWNMEIKVFIGLDFVWKASFHHQDSTKNVVNEKIILSRLTSYSGPEIYVPHALGALASKLSDYPQIKQWLYRCIRSGHMSVQAYRYLQRWIIAGKLE